MLFDGGNGNDQSVAMAAAAGALGLAASLPAQPASLRGSEAAVNISEEFMKEVQEITEQ